MWYLYGYVVAFCLLSCISYNEDFYTHTKASLIAERIIFDLLICLLSWACVVGCLINLYGIYKDNREEHEIEQEEDYPFFQLKKE